MYKYLVIYFILNSLSHMIRTHGYVYEPVRAWGLWLRYILFGTPWAIVSILYSVAPRWVWWEDNVKVWWFLWFTRKYADWTQEHVDFALQEMPTLRKKRFFKAICNKYNLKINLNKDPETGK